MPPTTLPTGQEALRGSKGQAARGPARAWAVFLVGLAFVVIARCVSWATGFDDPYAWSAVATVLVLVALPAFSVALEVLLFPTLVLILDHYHVLGSAWVNVPLFVATLVVLAHPLGSRLASVLVVVGSVVSIDVPALIASPPESPWAWVFLAAGGLALALFLAASGRPGRSVKEIDLVISSYSGNTAHFANSFCDAAAAAGARITEHRLHYYRDFAPELTGDALVVAYPVAGFNPFFPMLEYLLFKLPPGRGKPTFILYSSAGGPENGHLIPWLALWLRGYRVMGRLGGVYPMNVVLFRLVSSRLWRIFDLLLPRRSDLRRAAEAGTAFVHGRRAGLGLTLFPCIGFIVGPLTYNRFINHIYRGYSIKSLCNDCGRCIRFCPSERLFMKNGRVRSKGTCAMCYGCVNLCPTDAMQLALVSEIGNVYRPRWPKLIMKRRPRAGARSGDETPDARSGEG
jgi:ferredoxin